MGKKALTFTPDYAVPPGDTLLETLQTLGMSQAELANRTGRPLKTTNEIIKGKAAITPETALQLERVLGVPARFWNNLDRNYRDALARTKERKKITTGTALLRKIPVRALIQAKAIKDLPDKAALVVEVLNFFGVGSPAAWGRVWMAQRAVFRQSPAFRSAPGAVAAWLRIGELRAQRIQCAPFDRAKFRAALEQIRGLTVDPPEVFHDKLKDPCANAGVAVVFVSELPGTRVSGATRWLTPKKALIQLSLRYKSDDHLWFTLFHEAGHILLHGKRRVFLEDSRTTNAHEKEANAFAANTLIPPAALQEFQRRADMSKAAIRKFAQGLGISPGIVVGRLQHEGMLPYSHCNDLKRRFELVEREDSEAA